MQISTTETLKALTRPRNRRELNGGKVKNVRELAQKHDVNMDEARNAAHRAMMAEEDPLRARRIMELAARVAEGNYKVEGAQIVDMAERRAIADQVR